MRSASEFCFQQFSCLFKHSLINELFLSLLLMIQVLSSYLTRYNSIKISQGLRMDCCLEKNNSMVFLRKTYRAICRTTLGFSVFLWHRGIVRVKLLSQKRCISEWLSWTKEVQLKDCYWGDTIFCPITFDFHLLVVILVSMSSEPQESCFTEDLPFKAISFIHCG